MLFSMGRVSFLETDDRLSDIFCLYMNLPFCQLNLEGATPCVFVTPKLLNPPIFSRNNNYNQTNNTIAN